MSDLIDRQILKADLLCGDDTEHDYCFPCKEILKRIDDQPAAQPERKRGFWWAIEKGEKGYSAGNFRCSVCGKPNVSYIPKPNFCQNCGADMRGEQNDKQ